MNVSGCLKNAGRIRQKLYSTSWNVETTLWNVQTTVWNIETEVWNKVFCRYQTSLSGISGFGAVLRGLFFRALMDEKSGAALKRLQSFHERPHFAVCR